MPHRLQTPALPLVLLLEMICRALRRRLGRAGAAGALLAALLCVYVEMPLATARIAATEQQVVETATRSLTQALQEAVANTTAQEEQHP